MRIRTIKPTFWNHEQMCRECDDSARLLAIGLLNYADDQGFFLASPVLVRNALRPFDEDSTTTLRCLESLVKVGWIRIGKDASGRQIGEVVNFLKHQKIDRPNPQTLKGLCKFDDDSTNDQREDSEPSLWEGKGMEGMGKGRGMEGSPPSVPPAGGSHDVRVQQQNPTSVGSSGQNVTVPPPQARIEHPATDQPPRRKKERGGAALPFPDDFPETLRHAMSEWQAYKREKGQGYKPLGWAKLLRSVAGMSADELQAAVDLSMLKNWQGLVFRDQSVGKPGPGMFGRGPEKKEKGGRDAGEPAWDWRRLAGERLDMDIKMPWGVLLERMRDAIVKAYEALPAAEQKAYHLNAGGKS